MFSPGQVALSTLLGGPLAGAHLLYENFMELDKERQAKWTLLASVPVFAALMALGFLGNAAGESVVVLVWLLLAVGARQFTRIHQLTRQAIGLSREYTFQSNWKVLSIVVAWMVVTIMLALVISSVLFVTGCNL
ncbi:MAG: hypothetical protein KGK44_09675 [Gammaproteobacteria bacterium]|nr:hypothetical protein [Gammaproteobacteria bacterium]